MSSTEEVRIDVADVSERTSGMTLRVVAGPLQGANADVPAEGAITVGHGFRNSVVLRDKAVGDARVRIEAHGSAAMVEVLAGEVGLLGQRLAAPAKAPLPPYLPLQIGESAIAVGGADDGRWSECELLLPVILAPTEEPRDDKPRRRAPWVKDVAIGACAFGALAACTMLLAPSEQSDLGVPSAMLARDSLEANGFAEVVVSERVPGQPLLIQGFVASDARKALLRETLDGLDIDYVAEVRSGEAAARQVSDVFASGGYPGQARYAGSGTVLIEGVQADEEAAERLRGRALQDVPFVTAIRVQRAEPAPETRNVAFTGEIVQAVSGPDGYVVTQDGSRYFVGASTPIGGKLVAIEEGSVTIEEAGVPTRYVF